MSSALKQVIGEIVGAHREGINAGYDLQQKKLDAVLTAYDRALGDPKANIPTYLHAAIEGVRQKDAHGDLDVPKVEAVRGVSMTEYRLTGPLVSVQYGIKAIFDQFDGRGYGTRVHAIEMHNDGSYTARMSRSNSCE